MNVIEKMDVLKLADKGEYAVKAVRHGKDILVSTCTADGVMSFHQPYEIHENGKWEYSDLDVGEIDSAFKNGEVLYHNWHIRIKK